MNVRARKRRRRKNRRLANQTTIGSELTSLMRYGTDYSQLLQRARQSGLPEIGEGDIERFKMESLEVYGFLNPWRSFFRFFTLDGLGLIPGSFVFDWTVRQPRYVSFPDQFQEQFIRFLNTNCPVLLYSQDLSNGRRSICRLWWAQLGQVCLPITPPITTNPKLITIWEQVSRETEML